MSTVVLAQLVKPLVYLVLALCVFAPAVYAVRRWLPEGRLKRALLFKIR